MLTPPVDGGAPVTTASVARARALALRSRAIVIDGRLSVTQRFSIVGGDDGSGRPDDLREPTGDRTVAGADLEAAPVGLDAEAPEPANRPRVEASLEKREPAFLGCGVAPRPARTCSRPSPPASGPVHR